MATPFLLQSVGRSQHRHMSSMYFFTPALACHNCFKAHLFPSSQDPRERKISFSVAPWKYFEQTMLERGAGPQSPVRESRTDCFHCPVQGHVYMCFGMTTASSCLCLHAQESLESLAGRYDRAHRSAVEQVCLTRHHAVKCGLHTYMPICTTFLCPHPCCASLGTFSSAILKSA